MKNRKNSKSIEINGVYLSDVSDHDKTWDKHRANSDIVRDFYQETGKGKRSLRIDKCSRLLEFALKQDFQNGSLFRLLEARFCRVRLCPVCQWRRTLMWRARVFKAIPSIRADYPKHQFLFLTLTVRNCELDNLRETINWMNKSWLKLIKRKIFPAIGWIKSTEVTKGKDSKAHPHFHIILIVPSYYFKTKAYITKDKWIELWKKSLKVDYRPSIKINKVTLTKNRQNKISERLGRELTEDDVVFYGLMECLKYSVKESDLISSPQWLSVITDQLHKTRAIAIGGIFREYFSEDDPEDLINTEVDDEIEILETDGRFLFGWKEKVKRYQSL